MECCRNLQNIFFETYLLSNWTDASKDNDIHNAWAGHCFGMRDHFGILYNGDVVLCCIDINGHPLSRKCTKVFT